MITGKFSASQLRRIPGDPFHDIALRAAARQKAQTYLAAAERISDAIITAADSLCGIGRALISLARNVADLSMTAAEKFARTIIRLVDATQHHHNTAR